MTSTMAPPQNLDLEKAVLGGVLLRPVRLTEIASRLEPGHFYRRGHQKLYAAMLACAQQGERVDPLVLCDRLAAAGELEEAGGPAYVLGLTDGVPPGAPLVTYATTVRDKARLRALADAGDAIRAAACADDADADQVLDVAQGAILALDRGTATDLVPIDQVMVDAFAAIEALQDRPRTGVTGLETGFRRLDFLTSGLQPGELAILAARPSMGKTALALNVAAHAAQHASDPVLVFSLEMTQAQLAQRLIAADAKIDLHLLRGGQLTDADLSRLGATLARLSAASAFIDDTAYRTVTQIRALAHRVALERQRLSLIVVDYLQLLHPSGPSRRDSRHLELGAISQGLKALAKDLQVPVLALSQLSRKTEDRAGHEPSLGDLRDSGSLEADADLVWLLWRPEMYDPDNASLHRLAFLRIAKNRNGPTARISMHFEKAQQRFIELGS